MGRLTSTLILVVIFVPIVLFSHLAALWQLLFARDR